jgi:hypothetical protein
MSNLRIAELDFDTIKQNLKTFLKNQSEFIDYDFEGSALSTLLDILAYNTHYNAYLANMTINEMFLDSAVKRTSAVSIAKHLGYTPRSIRGAKATINITVNSVSGSPSTLTLSRFTPFTTTINGESLTFVNLIPYVIFPVDGAYIFNDVELTEGQNFEFNYTVSNPGPDEKYEIPNTNIDTSTLKVIVQNSAADTTQTVFTFYDDLSTVKNNSKVYFLEENPNGRFEIFFGDDVLGKKLSAGNIVILQYLLSNGSNGNVSNLLTQEFSISGTIEGNSNLTITTVNSSKGGADKELLSEIKFNAPRSYLSQNRAITADDYKSIIAQNHPEIESIAVWGGEDNDPPIYGKVIISLKPYQGFVISSSTKESIKNILLNSKRSLGIQSEFVDPEFIYVNLDVKTNFFLNKTTVSTSTLISQIRTAIENFFNLNLNKFDEDFYLSKLITSIDNTSTAITGTLIKISLQKRLEPTLNITNSFVGSDLIKMYNKIKPTGITSTSFNVIFNEVSTPAVIEDVPNESPPNNEGAGTLVLKNANSDEILNTNIGSVNYSSGDISINSITPIGYSSDQTDLRINAELQEESYNITADRQQVIILDDSTLNSFVNRKSGLVINIANIL